MTNSLQVINMYVRDVKEILFSFTKYNWYGTGVRKTMMATSLASPSLSCSGNANSQLNVRSFFPPR